MIDKLEWKDNAVQLMGLMEYIGIVENIYIPHLYDYEYNINIEIGKGELSKEAIEEHRNRVVGATDCMIIFKDRYNKRLLTIQPLYDKYLKEREIQSLLSHLELDVDKFWLLLLFIFDYCESMFYQGITMKLTPWEQLCQLADMINKSTNDSMTLNFKSGKLKVELDDPRAIRTIATLIYMMEPDREDLEYLSRRVRAEETKEIKDSPIIAYFARMLLTFFLMQPQLRAKRREGAKHSVKETDLVCQLIYFTRLSKNESWLNTENETLKPFLKQYKNYNYQQNISSVYPEFYA